MSKTVSVTGPVDGDPGANAEYGTGVYIGDGYILTAGHVAFEYDHASDSNPSGISVGNIRSSNSFASATVLFDPREYQAQYAQDVAATYAYDDANSLPRLDNIHIESLADMRAKDMVVISGSGSVGSSDYGLVAFLNPTDLTDVSGSIGLGAEVSRVGDTTGTVHGNILTASGGVITFGQPSQPGDSGGPYLLNFDGSSYVLGVQSASNSTTAYGTYLSVSEWHDLTTLVTTGHTGNLTLNEPVNLLVGSTSADSMAGTIRADRLYGNDGNDHISDGDTLAAWGNDTLVGGTGDDTLSPGKGNDVLWGGDQSQEIVEPGAHDVVDYSSFGTAGAISVSYSSDGGLASITVKDNFGDTDTLHAVTTIVGTSKADILKIAGSISPDETLTFDANHGQNGALEDILNGSGATLGAGFTVTIGPDGSGTVSDNGSGGVIHLLNFDSDVVGTSGNDTVTDTTDGHKHFDGGDGDDYLSVAGSSAGSTLTGGLGNDTLFGGSGDDFLAGGPQGFWSSQDEIHGGDGNDYLVTTGGVDSVFGDAGNDYISIQEPHGNARVWGGEGDDIIDARTGGYKPNWYGGSNPDISFAANDGHDVVLTNPNSPAAFVSYNEGSWNIHVELTDVSFNDVELIWDVRPSSDPLFADGYFEGTGDLAIVIKSTGASLAIQGVGGYAGFGSGPGDVPGTMNLNVGITDKDGNIVEQFVPAEHGGVSQYFAPLTNYLASAAAGPVSIGGTSGDDVLTGAQGNDMLSGGDGNDTFQSSGGTDSIDGGTGDDTLFLLGNRAAYTVAKIGSSGDFSIVDTSSATHISAHSVERVYFESDDASYTSQDLTGYYGTAGNDLLEGHGIGASFYGLGGDDTIESGYESNVIDGGNGDDTVIYEGSSADYQISFNKSGGVDVANAPNNHTKADSLIDIENIYFNGDHVDLLVANLPPFGTSADDLIIGTSRGESLYGMDGNDTIQAGGGTDFVEGGNGNDSITDSSGDDYLSGGNGNDFIGAGSGAVFLDGGEGNDTLVGGSGGDVFFAGGGINVIQIASGGGEDAIGYEPGSTNILELTGWKVGDTRIAPDETGTVLNITSLGTAQVVSLISGATATLPVTTILFDDGTKWFMAGADGAHSWSAGNEADTFIFSLGAGNHTISDFTTSGTNSDVLTFNTDVFSTWQQVANAAEQVGSDVVITIDSNDSITLSNTSLASLTSSDVAFLGS